MAVLPRYKGRPVAFWMEERPSGTPMTTEELEQKIQKQAGERLLREHMREEIGQPTRPDRLPSFTVAICTKDRPARLARCLDGLKAMRESEAAHAFDGKASDLLDILVVDNAPSDAQTRKEVEQRPGVRYVREPKPGLDFARNRALRETDHELIAYLDDDVVVDTGWLAGLLEAWTENPDAAAFTGLVLPYELDTEAQIIFEQRGGFRRGFEKIRYQGQERPGNPLYPCAAGTFGAGANMAFRRKVLLELGGFDEALDTGRPLPGGGDLDMFYRVIRTGYPLVYEPRYLVFHEHRRSLEGLRRQYWSWGLGLMAFLTKSHRTDPSQRVKQRRVILWWFGYQLRQVAKSLASYHTIPVDMVVAEIRGGLEGLIGGYTRSQNRTEHIRKQFS